jgi:hypothetical protein
MNFGEGVRMIITLIVMVACVERKVRMEI